MRKYHGQTMLTFIHFYFVAPRSYTCDGPEYPKIRAIALEYPLGAFWCNKIYIRWFYDRHVMSSSFHTSCVEFNNLSVVILSQMLTFLHKC